MSKYESGCLGMALFGPTGRFCWFGGPYATTCTPSQTFRRTTKVCTTELGFRLVIRMFVMAFGGFHTYSSAASFCCVSLSYRSKRTANLQETCGIGRIIYHLRHRASALHYTVQAPTDKRQPRALCGCSRSPTVRVAKLDKGLKLMQREQVHRSWRSHGPKELPQILHAITCHSRDDGDETKRATSYAP